LQWFSSIFHVFLQVFQTHVLSVSFAFRHVFQTLHLDVSKVDQVWRILQRDPPSVATNCSCWGAAQRAPTTEETRAIPARGLATWVMSMACGPVCVWNAGTMGAYSWTRRAGAGGDRHA
jgi:hypothetical protein